ncbi:TraR/DksA C4-type zinc finger protein [soil metagenome]
MSEKTRYTDTELQEFKDLISDKLENSRNELKYLQEQINRSGDIGDDSDTKFSGLEDGSATMEREYLNQMASRQIQYIQHLEKALVRIENKTYGICRDTGKLISPERLRAVPHATLSIEAKNAQNK